jgi:hypothetical protein
VPDDSFCVCCGCTTACFSFSSERLMRATSSASSEDMWLFTSSPSARILAMRSLFGMPTSFAISYTRIFAPVILRLDPWGCFYSDCTGKTRAVFPQIIAIFVVDRRIVALRRQVSQVIDDPQDVRRCDRASQRAREARRGDARGPGVNVGAAAGLPPRRIERNLRA